MTMERRICPGCSESIYFDPMDGWRNDNGFTCWPLNTTHGQNVQLYLEKVSA